MGKWKEKIENLFSAAAFAEAGCHELAREFPGKGRAIPAEKPLDFAAAVGLKGVRVWYGIAQVAA
jgi:hypothetical protein